MSSGYVSRMWFAWVPPKMRDIGIFSECRKRDVPVGNLSSRNNSVATPFSGCCHVPFVLVRVYLFVFFRLLFRSLSFSLCIPSGFARVRITMAFRVSALYLPSLGLYCTFSCILHRCLILFLCKYAANSCIERNPKSMLPCRSRYVFDKITFS